MKFFKENGPHIKSEDTTSKIMTRLLIALAPIICFVIFKNSMLVYYYTDATPLQALHPVLMMVTATLPYILYHFTNYKTFPHNDLSPSQVSKASI